MVNDEVWGVWGTMCVWGVRGVGMRGDEVVWGIRRGGGGAGMLGVRVWVCGGLGCGGRVLQGS